MRNYYYERETQDIGVSRMISLFRNRVSAYMPSLDQPVTAASAVGETATNAIMISNGLAQIAGNYSNPRPQQRNGKGKGNNVDPALLVA